jgi:hypothetical protein
MKPEHEYSDLIRRLASSLQQVEGFRAISSDADGVTVYLEPGDPGAASRIEQIIRRMDSAVPIRYVPSGEFRAL